jgi:hypothetical protein
VGCRTFAVETLTSQACMAAITQLALSKAHALTSIIFFHVVFCGIELLIELLASSRIRIAALVMTSSVAHERA